MPAVTSGSKVLVTGANGYIAVWIVKTLLERGFRVRSAVRSESKAGFLRDMFKSYGDKHEIVIVPDIEKEGAFDEAFQGVDAVAHTASPASPAQSTSPEAAINPAVNGTVNVLKSAQKSKTVKRIVITSSVAAVTIFGLPPSIYTEDNWNDAAVSQVKEKGKDANQIVLYMASKTLAEKAAWEFVEKNKDSINFDIGTICPPYVLGPIINDVPTAEEQNGSMGALYNVVIKGQGDSSTLSTGGDGFVDVRDLAVMHSLVLETPAAGGERFLGVSPQHWVFQEWINAANAAGIYDNLPKGDTSYTSPPAAYARQYDNSKSVKILGMKYRLMDETIKDMLVDWKAKGW